ncbi:MAG: O-antigen translocase [Salinivirgaceae bacterium]
MSENQSSYRQIMKATSLFGGVQVFKIIIQIVQSKVVALLLGPHGMGIIGLLNSNLQLLAGLTNFGLGTSAVKNISEAHATGDRKKVALVVWVLRKLVWATGLLGAVLTLVFSSWLSEITFGNRDYTMAFVWISCTLLFNQLSAGQLVLLQGLRQLKHLANANLTGSLLGLVIAIPLYYYYRIEGIVPVIIATSLANMVRSWYFARKVTLEKPISNKQEEKAAGKEMLKMGFMLSLSGLLTIGTAYLLRIFISRTGDVAQVGLYAAGFAIIESYVGLVFSAMSTDYYPKLSAINKDNEKVRTLVSQQATIAILILMPIIVVFIIFSKVIIQILYSTQFLAIEQMLNWAIMGMLLRGVSWSMGFILFAKSDSSLFLKTALGFNTLFLLINLAGYHWGGLTGLGITFLINYSIHFVVLLGLTKKRYEFYFDKLFYKLLLITGLIVLLSFSISFISKPFLKYIFGAVIILIATAYALYELDKRMNLKEILRKLKNRKQ